MAFRTNFGSPDPCPRCGQAVAPGSTVVYTDDDRKVMAHVDCDPSESQEDRAETLVYWGIVTEETLERMEREALEEARVAPIGPQGVCPKCFLELPKSKVCGVC